MYSDYEKIVSSEKLPDFLFHYFNVYGDIPWVKETGEQSFYQSLEFTAKKYDSPKWFFKFFDKIFLWLYCRKRLSKSKKRILFRPFKYANIIFGVKKHHHAGLIVHGLDRLVAIKNGMGYVITSDLDQYLLAYSRDKNIEHLYKLIKTIENKLRAASPDYIVLWNDTLPMERAIVLASKKLGITTLEIQHGIYNSFFPLITGKVVDYVLVWGEYFKNIYVKQGKRKPEDIYILGYPYLIEKHNAEQNKKKYAVCYLGEDLERFNDDFLKIKLETMHCLSKMCKKMGLEFIYRPHPGDDRKMLEEKLPYIHFTPVGGRLEETFKKADIFISFQSTALIEATMRSKIALQLMNYPIKSDNFETSGVCNKSLNTLEELDGYLRKISVAKNLNAFKVNFNNDYVETRYNPTQRFLEILKEIENKKITQ